MATIRIQLELIISIEKETDIRIYCENRNYYTIEKYNLKENPLLSAIINNALVSIDQQAQIILTDTNATLKEG